MDYDDHVDAVERESAAITIALGAGPTNAVVPTCPDFTVVELATHLGQFCGLWTHVLCEGTDQPKTPYADPAPGEDRPEWFAGWYAEAAANLVTRLRATDPDARVWTWDPTNPTAAFVARRCANELAVHRYDTEATRGSARPVDGALAVDGIEEIFAMIAAWRAGGTDRGSGNGESIHLHATDPEAEWTITLTPDGPIVDRRHAKADVALQGSASDLELLLYSRPPLGPVERFGDEAAFEAWPKAFTFG